jgi:hypothetical protein
MVFIDGESAASALRGYGLTAPDGEEERTADGNGR